MDFSNFPMQMSVEELSEALSTGSVAEPVEVWAPRVAAVLITITLHNPEIIKDHPEDITNYLRLVTARMPAEILIAAAMGLVEINKIASVEGMTPELYAEVQDAFKDIEGDNKGE